ncbi:MAG: hypothetical protein AVDCRST_MAG03-2799, partial [uncultured Rubrobacteraceae bacterium]
NPGPDRFGTRPGRGRGDAQGHGRQHPYGSRGPARGDCQRGPLPGLRREQLHDRRRDLRRRRQRADL